METLFFLLSFSCSACFLPLWLPPPYLLGQSFTMKTFPATPPNGGFSWEFRPPTLSCFLLRSFRKLLLFHVCSHAFYLVA